MLDVPSMEVLGPFEKLRNCFIYRVRMSNWTHMAEVFKLQKFDSRKCRGQKSGYAVSRPCRALADHVENRNCQFTKRRQGGGFAKQRVSPRGNICDGCGNQ